MALSSHPLKVFLMKPHHGVRNIAHYGLNLLIQVIPRVTFLVIIVVRLARRRLANIMDDQGSQTLVKSLYAMANILWLG